MDKIPAARPSARVRRAANCTALWRFSDRALHQRALQNLLHVARRNPKAAEDGIIYELGKVSPTIEQDIMAGVSTEGLNYKLKHSDLCPHSDLLRLTPCGAHRVNAAPKMCQGAAVYGVWARARSPAMTVGGASPSPR